MYPPELGALAASMSPAPESLDSSIVGGLRLVGAELRARAKIVRASDLREERRRCEGSLIEFMIRAWEEIEPGELDVNWHHEEIAAVLRRSPRPGNARARAAAEGCHAAD